MKCKKIKANNFINKKVSQCNKDVYDIFAADVIEENYESNPQK